MLGSSQVKTIGKVAIVAALAGQVASVGHAWATDMTAGTIMKEMPVRERAAYVMGIVEGFAYARFRKDTVAAGTKNETGMKCIYDWFYKDTAASFDLIEAVFKKYPEHFPSTLIASMTKKECGE